MICYSPEDCWSGKLRELGAKVVSIKVDGSGTGVLSEAKLAYSIFKQLKRDKPNFLFNFTIKMNLYFGLSASILGIPYCNNVSGLGTAFIHEKVLYKIVQAFYGIANARCKKVFFQNVEDRDLFLSRGLVTESKQFLLPGSGVDTSRFIYSAPPRSGPFTFLMVARLIADKGVREFVDAARLLKAEYPNIRFILVGPSGVQNKTAISTSEIIEWQKEGIVEFPGPQDDILPWLHDCHVFVLPSYREGMPKTVIEAAAVGRPAIVSDVPGCRQSVIADDTGWLCSARSSESLAIVMKMVFERHQTEPGWLDACGYRASVRVRNEFSEDIVINAYLDCLK